MTSDAVLGEAIAIAEATIAGDAPAPVVWSDFHGPTGSVSHLVREPHGTAALIIDSVLDLDDVTQQIGTDTADRLAAYVEQQGLRVLWHVETHVHADHLTAGPYLQRRLGGELVVGAGVMRVAAHLAESSTGPCPIDAYDRLVRDGDRLRLGAIDCLVLETPGHTPSDISLVVGDSVFIGDTLFMPDIGTARADFPGGDAGQLYRSAMRLLALPETTRMFVCHDYPDGVGRGPRWTTTVAEQLRDNVHLATTADAAAYRALREARDRTLAEPRLMRRALGHNLAAALPE